MRENGTVFVSLLEGCGDIDVSCLHLSPGAQLCDLSMLHDRAVLVLQGNVVAMAGALRGNRVELSPGRGLVLKPGERFQVIECLEGAVLMLVEAQWLDASRVGLRLSSELLGSGGPDSGDPV